ncbi:hypothetical protein BDB01DRAFT_777012 [Pilobolus umbonatus]|nr:hypothetical protein BDB01DRAFT_777012 [Pilobolus umbonatus]
MSLFIYSLFILSLLPYTHQQSCIKPSNYSDFNVIFMSNQLYITGGNRNSLEVLSKDLSAGIKIDNCWKSLYDARTTVDYSPYENGVSFPISNTSFAIQAGDSSSAVMSNIVVYDTVTNTWSKQTKGDQPLPRSRMSVSVNTTTHVAWYYGGRTVQSQINSDYFNDFYSYDIHTLTWNWPTVDYYGGIRPARYGHASILISNYLFIMGGKSVIKSSSDSNWIVSPGDFQSILIFDTERHQSITMATIGKIPPSSYSFSSITAPDGKSIVLFGGQNTTSDEIFDASNDVYVLDTCTLNWTMPVIQGTPPTPRAGHESVVYKNDYMIVLMGIQGYDINHGPIYSDQMYILHMPTWTWIDSIPAGTVESNPISPNCTFIFPVVPEGNGDSGNMPFDSSILENKSLKTKQMAFGITFGIMGFILLVAISILLLRRWRSDVDASRNPRWIPALLKKIRVKKEHSDSNGKKEYNRIEDDNSLYTYY